MSVAKEYIKSHGIKMSWIADNLGISRVYLYDILTGRRGKRSLPKYAPRIAEILRAEVTELFPGLDNGQMESK